MTIKRIIPCLDMKDGKVIKGKKFVDLRYAGDPIKLAKRYDQEGADELVFLDINASYENRKTMTKVVKKVTKQISIPLTVGGGIKRVANIKDVLNAGADKVGIGTTAVLSPNLIKMAVQKFGSQRIIIAIDAKRNKEKWEVFIKGGREPTGIDALKWARKVEKLGAGEILLTSMDRDGTKRGYDLELTRRISEVVTIPVIASGGAGTLKDMLKVLKIGQADAVLAASIFHYKKYSISEVKEYLSKNGIEVRK